MGHEKATAPNRSTTDCGIWQVLDIRRRHVPRETTVLLHVRRDHRWLGWGDYEVIAECAPHEGRGLPAHRPVSPCQMPALFLQLGGSTGRVVVFHGQLVGVGGAPTPEAARRPQSHLVLPHA